MNFILQTALKTLLDSRLVKQHVMSSLHQAVSQTSRSWGTPSSSLCPWLGGRGREEGGETNTARRYFP